MAWAWTLNGRVTQLEIYNNQLRGSIPPSLGRLTNLTQLEIYKNQLSGPIPSSLGSLTNLQFLNLGENNGLSGSIPSSLGSLRDLAAFVSLAITG